MVTQVKKSVIIPPYWVDLLIGLLALLFGIYFPLITRALGSDYKTSEGFFYFVGAGTMIRGSVHFSIHSYGIWVRCLWIPIRLIRWDHIASAEYIEKWSTGAKFGQMEGQGIAITLHSCPAFFVELDALNMFQLKHPFSFCFIRFTPRNRKTYVEVFRQYYPKLFFQFGCDHSWLTND